MALKQVDASNPPRFIKSDQNSIIVPEKGESTLTIITQEQTEKTWTTIPDKQEECTFTISQEHGDKSLSTIFQEEERDTWTTVSLSSSPLSSPLRSKNAMNLQIN